jgi:hypothetical protein
MSRAGCLPTGLHNLHLLLEALAEKMIGMDHVRDGERDADMDQATAMASIARDAAERLIQIIED